MSETDDDPLDGSALLKCRVNGQLHEVEIEPLMSLLEMLRTTLGLTGTHMGCQTGHCGACTVTIDGHIAKSCLTLAASMSGRVITTLEGLAAPDGTLTLVQQAFCDEAGFQCAYCAPGMIFSTIELLAITRDPSDAEIREALAGNLCRCTGYQSIVRAVRTAAARQRGEQAQNDDSASGVSR